MQENQLHTPGRIMLSQSQEGQRNLGILRLHMKHPMTWLSLVPMKAQNYLGRMPPMLLVTEGKLPSREGDGVQVNQTSAGSIGQA